MGSLIQALRRPSLSPAACLGGYGVVCLLAEASPSPPQRDALVTYAERRVRGAILDELRKLSGARRRAAAALRALLCRYGSNWRGLVDLTWRVEDSQGFIQDGNAGVRAPAASISGDGVFSADLDWKLKQDQNLSVTCSNRINRAVDPECDTHLARSLPWVAVCFWAERDRS